jgi:hypothetical protein
MVGSRKELYTARPERPSMFHTSVSFQHTTEETLATAERGFAAHCEEK